jgi:hypothetical protein
MRKLFSAIAGATLLAGAIACGVVDLKSVTAASQLGSVMTKDTESVRTMDLNCQLLKAAKLASKCPMEGDKWSNALQVVGAYAQQLGKMANDGDPGVGDAVDSALGTAEKARWLSLTSDQDQNISNVAGKIAHLLTLEARRQYLVSTIKDVQSSLDQVLAGLVAHLIDEQQYLTITRCQVACQSGQKMDDATCPDTKGVQCPAPEPSVAMSLASLSIDLSNESTRIANEQKAVTAFRTAHTTLATNAERLSADDVYKAVLEDISVAFKSKSGGGDGGVTEGGAK